MTSTLTSEAYFSTSVRPRQFVSIASGGVGRGRIQRYPSDYVARVAHSIVYPPGILTWRERTRPVRSANDAVPEGFTTRFTTALAASQLRDQLETGSGRCSPFRAASASSAERGFEISSPRAG